MLTSSISNTYWCHSVGEPCNFIDSLCFYFWFWQMLLPMILGNLMLLAVVIVMLPLGLQLMFSVLAGVIAMLLCFPYGRW